MNADKRKMGSEIKTWEGDLSAAGMSFAIVVARFNGFITQTGW